MSRQRLFSPHIYQSADDLLWREHNTRQKRLTVILLLVLALGVWLLVCAVKHRQPLAELNRGAQQVSNQHAYEIPQKTSHHRSRPI